MIEPESSKSRKRRFDSADGEPVIDSRPHKQSRLNSAEDHTGTNALSDQKQKFRREDHSAGLDPKQNAAKLPEQRMVQPVAAAEPVKMLRPLSARTQLTKVKTTQEHLEAGVEEFMQRVEKLEKRQEPAIKEAVENTVNKAVTDAVDKSKEAFTEKLPRALEEAITKQLPGEVQKAVTEELPKALEKAVSKQLPEALEDAVNKLLPGALEEAVKKQLLEAVQNAVAEQLEKVQEAIASKAAERVIVANTTNLEDMKADYEKKAAEELAKLHAQFKDARKTLDKQHNELASELAQEHQATIEKVEKATAQAAESAKEADAKLQKALDATGAAESASRSTQNDLKYHSELLKEHQGLLIHATRQLDHSSSRNMRPASPSAETPSSQDLMDLDGAAYPSPNSSHFASSTSSTTNNVSTHDDKPRQGLRFNAHGNGRLSDPENIAMRNHSRRGISSEYNVDSDEELPTSSVPRSDYRPFRSSAEQAPRSFGRPSIGNDTDQSYSHRASRNTPFYPFQQHATYLDGAEQSNSRAAAPPSRAQYTPAQERIINPSRNTSGASQARANYTQTAQQQQQQQQQRTNNGLNGYEQSNFRRAASPSRKRAHADDDDEWEDYHTETPSQEQDARSSKRARFLDDTQQSNSFPDDTHQSASGHSGSQLSTQGRGGRARGRGRGGHMQRDRAPLNVTTQPSSSYVASPAHDQGGYTPGPARRNNTAQPPFSHSASAAHDQGGYPPRGPARGKNIAQSSSSYSASPAYNQGGYTPGPVRRNNTAQQLSLSSASPAHNQGAYTSRGPAPRNNTAQSSSFVTEQTSQEYNHYATSRATEADKRTAVDESLRAPQSQGQSQSQQPQHNGRSTMNRSGCARNGDAEDDRSNNLRYAPPLQPQGPRSFGRNTHASSSRLEEPASAGARAIIEDEGEEQMARVSRQFGETMRRKKTPNMSQPGAQQRDTAHTPAQGLRSSRDTKGLLPEPARRELEEACENITRTPASGNDLSGGDLASRITHPSDEDESSGQRSSNGKKGPSKFASLPDGGLMSRSTFPKRR